MTAQARPAPFSAPRRRPALRLAANNSWPLLRAEPPRQRAGSLQADLLVPVDAPRADRLVTTAAGITIGIAYLPRAQPQGTHAEQLQAALLDREMLAASTWRSLWIALRRWL